MSFFKKKKSFDKDLVVAKIGDIILELKVILELLNTQVSKSSEVIVPQKIVYDIPTDSTIISYKDKGEIKNLTVEGKKEDFNGKDDVIKFIKNNR